MAARMSWITPLLLFVLQHTVLSTCSYPTRLAGGSVQKLGVFLTHASVSL
jgi:hypothetical protein